MTQQMPLPFNISCSSKSDWFYLPGFTFLVPAYQGSPGQNPMAIYHAHGATGKMWSCGLGFRIRIGIMVRF